MQHHPETKEHTKFHKFLKDVLQNIPNKYPRSYYLKEFGWNDFNKIGKELKFFFHQTTIAKAYLF